ncbi:LPS export ABC transporter periplasmic protein LptC [Consotaella aegiceratis]|uniref:LPS export ABC transporter periplasmic protein LptC n=1 Tax=Consotaella aegiceratis TaxID=3097961 RepID=UPI002F3EE2F4
MSKTFDPAIASARGAADGPSSHPHNDRLEKEFRRARRHSVIVRMLKLGLPLLAVLILLGAAVATWIARNLPEDMSVSETSIADGRVVMENPRLTGFDNKDQPYWMVADQAFQSLTSGEIELDGIRANITLGDGSTADITSTKGFFDPDKQTLSLSSDVHVATSDGTTMDLDQAEIDIAAGQMVGQGPVSILRPHQTVDAGSITVENGGKQLSFGGRVKMMLLPEGQDSMDRQANESR